MVLLAWDNKKATTQLKEMCEQHPVDFFLLKRCAANTSALRDVIRGIAKCRVDYTPREIVDIDAALESTLYGNNTGEWKEKLQQFAPDTVSDKELAAWMKERSLDTILFNAITGALDDPSPGSNVQALSLIGYLLEKFVSEHGGSDETPD